MKKNILSLILILLTTISFSQDKHEKIKALKVAQITDVLSLTEKEAQKFWPIYNAFEKKDRELKNTNYQLRKKINFETITEDEANLILKETNEFHNKKNSLHNKYISDLLKVLPAKKVLLLKKAENEFKRKMFDEYKKRKEKRP